MSFDLRNMSMRSPLSITNCYDDSYCSRPFEAKESIFILKMVY